MGHGPEARNRTARWLASIGHMDGRTRHLQHPSCVPPEPLKKCGADSSNHELKGHPSMLSNRRRLPRILSVAATLAALLAVSAATAHGQGVEVPDPTYFQVLDEIGPTPSSQEVRSYRRIGAVVGGVVGATATYFALNSGGSTSLCDKSANQDATSTGLCVGLYALGGLVGAGLGSLIGGAITVESMRDTASDALRVGIGFRLRP